MHSESHRRPLSKLQHSQIARKTMQLGLALVLFGSLQGCGGGEGDGGPVVTVAPGSGSPTQPGASASLTWSPVNDPSVYGYFVHYGPQSPSSTGSCNYAESVFVPSSAATVTGLAYSSTYYFAVSATNGRESACSNEVSTPTPPAPV